MSPFTLLAIPAFSLLSFSGWELHPALHGAIGQIPSTPPFDIPCGQLTGEDDPVPALHRRDFAAAIAASRISVSQDCDNEFRWIQLARVYQLAGKNPEALAIAAYVFERKPNELARWFSTWNDNEADDEGNPLNRRNLEPLLEIPGWAESEWGRAWTAAVAARDRRIARGRALLAALPPERRPADNYVTGEACPFECCTYREWTVEEEIELFASANGPRLGRKLLPGDQVLGLTGNVHLRPRPIFLQRPIQADDDAAREQVVIAAGDLIFELESEGEGYFHIWYRGRILSAETGWLLQQGCMAIDDECWGDFLDEKRKPEEYQWWVKVRLKDGSTAWALAKGFGNMDACG